MGICLVCVPEQPMSDLDLLDHLRLMHPDVYGDGFERWADGRIVVYDTTLQPGEFDL
jgi:hypothetical protein